MRIGAWGHPANPVLLSGLVAVQKTIRDGDVPGFAHKKVPTPAESVDLPKVILQVLQPPVTAGTIGNKSQLPMKR